MPEFHEAKKSDNGDLYPMGQVLLRSVNVSLPAALNDAAIIRKMYGLGASKLPTA
jgi:hypothetical protein